MKIRTIDNSLFHSLSLCLLSLRLVDLSLIFIHSSCISDCVSTDSIHCQQIFITNDLNCVDVDNTVPNEFR